MNINIENAIKKFFSNPSFQMVYSEAIANSLDADAKHIEVRIYCNSYSDMDSLVIEIQDDGNGFTDENLKKFSELLQNSDELHKGLGRLIYLAYFREVEIESVFDGHKRLFTFTKQFDPRDVVKEDAAGLPNSTILRFTSYWKNRIRDHNFLNPAYLKKYILTKFIPNLYALKKADVPFEISFSLIVPREKETKNFYSFKETLTATDLPDFIEKEVTCENLDFFNNKLTISYSIKKTGGAGSLVTAIAVDNRILPQRIFNEGKIPQGNEVFLILTSSFFDGKTDDDHENLKLDPADLPLIKRVFTKYASEILNKEIPELKTLNENAVVKMADKYPFLNGLFDKEYVGLIDEEESVAAAQNELFKQEKILLEADSIPDDKIEETLNTSARKLAQYILYRTKIIKKLSAMKLEESEGTFHDIIIPRKKVCNTLNFQNDLYLNNVWLLDDKFMTYSHVLSDQEMSDLLKVLAIDDELENPNKRPDIAVVFSSDVSDTTSTQKSDVVIVELKKPNASFDEKRKVEAQIRDRARRLLKYSPGKIDRLWAYGIMPFDDEFRRELKETKWHKVFSQGEVYYQEMSIYADDGNEHMLAVYLMSHDTLWKDAETRNSTFLKILKDGFAKYSESDLDSEEEKTDEETSPSHLLLNDNSDVQAISEDNKL